MKIIKSNQIHKYAYQNLFCYLPKQNLSKRWTKESLVSDKQEKYLYNNKRNSTIEQREHNIAKKNSRMKNYET